MICKIGFGDGHIVLLFGRKIEWTSCTYKHSKNIFYLLERFNNVNILGMREDFRLLCLIDVSIITIHASGGGGGGGGVNRRQTLSFVIWIDTSHESHSVNFRLLCWSSSQKSTLSSLLIR